MKVLFVLAGLVSIAVSFPSNSYGGGGVNLFFSFNYVTLISLSIVGGGGFPQGGGGGFPQGGGGGYGGLGGGGGGHGGGFSGSSASASGKNNIFSTQITHQII